MASTNYVSTGLSMGGVMAMIMSWYFNHSIGWCILHGICGWFYVLYAWLEKSY